MGLDGTRVGMAQGGPIDHVLRVPYPNSILASSLAVMWGQVGVGSAVGPGLGYFGGPKVGEGWGVDAHRLEWELGSRGLVLWPGLLGLGL